jgi:CitMHS family citrate-Mg2+:H+ or citrate-Ca2+:H+ symporter
LFMYAILGYAMTFLIVGLLLTKKVTPMVAFITIPPVVSLLAGYSIAEVSGFISSGVSKTLNTSLLMLVSMVFFSIATNLGIFDPPVEWLVKRVGSHISVVMVVACLVAHLTHLDTGSTSTLLVTIPAMLPIFKRMKINPIYLYTIIATAMAIVNLLPWGGSTMRAANMTGLDAAFITASLLPVMAVGFVFNICCAWFMGQKIQREHTKLNIVASEGPVDIGDVTKNSGLVVDADRVTVVNAKYWFNLSIVLGAMILIFIGKLPGYYVFMLGIALLLIVNFKTDIKQWDKIIDKYAQNAYRITVTMFCTGIYAGVLTESAMLDAMSGVISGAVPTALGGFFNILIAPLGFIFGAIINVDGFMYGMLPVLIRVAEGFGFTVATLVFAAVLGSDASGAMLRPVSAVPWMACGMLGIEFVAAAKKTIPYSLALLAVEITAAVLFGIIPILF